MVDHPKLDRKKKVKAAAEGDPTEQAPTDPFNKFRKLFGGKKNKKADAKDAVATASKEASAPKAESAAKAPKAKAPAATKTKAAAKKGEK